MKASQSGHCLSNVQEDHGGLTVVKSKLLDSFFLTLEREPERIFCTVYKDPFIPKEISFAAIAAFVEKRASILENFAPERGLVFVVHDDPIEQMAWWIAIVYSGRIPGLLTPPTPKLDSEKYGKDLAATLTAHTNASLIVAEKYEEITTGTQSHRILIMHNISASSGSGASALLPPYREPSSPLLFQQSSGTTGLRKGILLSEESVTRQLDTYAQAIKLTDNDCIVSWLPLYHDMGLVACFLLSLYTTTPFVLTSPFTWLTDPAWLIRAVFRHRGTLCWMPNFAFCFMADQVDISTLPTDALKTLRMVISCAEPILPNSVERFEVAFSPLGLAIGICAGCYAMAETTYAVTQSHPGHGIAVETVDTRRLWRDQIAVPSLDGKKRLAGSGHVLEGTEVRIGVGLMDGQVDEIYIRSHSAMSGYFGVGTERKAFDQNGWYASGDFGYLRKGELFIIGRIKDQIIRAGVNIDPGDIEIILGEIKEVKAGRIAAFGIPNEREGTEDIVVIAEFAGKQVTDMSAVLDSCRKLAVQQLLVPPQRIEFVRSGWLIKSSSGKISRVQNREKYLRMCTQRLLKTICVGEYVDDIDEDLKDSFAYFGDSSRIRGPVDLSYPGRVRVGNWVSLGRRGRIVMQTDTSQLERFGRQHYTDADFEYASEFYRKWDSMLTIGDGTQIGNDYCISCWCRIDIGRHVLISDRVFITDALHRHESMNVPILVQSMSEGRPICIDNGAWIGVGVTILPGVHIGKNALIGAGSVVSKNVPDGAVVVGNPARVVRMVPPSISQKKQRAVQTTENRELARKVARVCAEIIGEPVQQGDSLFTSGRMDSILTQHLLINLEILFGKIDSASLLGSRADTPTEIAHQLSLIISN